MEDKLAIAKQSSFLLWRTIARIAVVAVFSVFNLLVIVGLVTHPTSAAQLEPSSNAVGGSQGTSAYLYRFEGGSFVTITLPVGGGPADVSVVSGTHNDQIWFTEPGLNRIGRVVYTSSLDYAITEYPVNGSPIDIAASNTDVWFTLPSQNQLGHLDAESGLVELINLPSANAEPADIAIDSTGRAWVTERAANRIAAATISPTVVITEYIPPMPGLKPEGLALDNNGNVWFAAGATGALWRFTPSNNEFVGTPVLSGQVPYRIAVDAANNIWATFTNTNQLVRLVPGSQPITTTYPPPTADSEPGAIGVNSLNQIYFAEQAKAQIGRLTLTSTAVFAEYPLPQPDLKLTSLAISDDDAVWAVAYRTTYQLHLPLVMRNYPAPVPPFAVQMYGAINATSGITWVVGSGARWIRVPIQWAAIEPVNTTPDKYSWDTWDASIRTASEAGIHLIATISTNPAWAAAHQDGPVTNVVDLQEFVGAVVARYPQITYWEFYNEPDRFGRFGLNGAGYATMLQTVYPTVKAANSAAQVVMGGLAMDWFIEDGGVFDSHFLTDVVAACTGTCFDMANFHYYPGFRSRWEPYGRDISGKAAFIRQILTTYGYSRPLMNTETHWPAATTTGSPELAARYVAKVYARSLASDLRLTNWFALTDVDSSGPGLLEAGWVPRPSFIAYQIMAALLGQAKYVRAIPSTETGSPQIEAYQFSVPGATGLKRLDVYWYDCPSVVITGKDCDSTASLRINAAPIAMIDKLGVKTILTDIDDGSIDGQVTIPGGIGTSPIYIDYQP